jgi:hypothetical protein
MPVIDVYGPRKQMEVMQDTWGHLAPRPRVKYRGYILIAESVFPGQGRTTVDTDFVTAKGKELDSSPWFYDALTDYVCDLEGLEDGKVYLWEGTYEFFAGSKKERGRDPYLDESRYRFTQTGLREVPIALPDLTRRRQR